MPTIGFHCLNTEWKTFLSWKSRTFMWIRECHKSIHRQGGDVWNFNLGWNIPLSVHLYSVCYLELFNFFPSFTQLHTWPVLEVACGACLHIKTTSLWLCLFCHVSSFFRPAAAERAARLRSKRKTEITALSSVRSEVAEQLRYQAQLLSGAQPALTIKI